MFASALTTDMVLQVLFLFVSVLHSFWPCDKHTFVVILLFLSYVILWNIRNIKLGSEVTVFLKVKQ